LSAERGFVRLQRAAWRELAATGTLAAFSSAAQREMREDTVHVRALHLLRCASPRAIALPSGTPRIVVRIECVV
jgi:hypothetical protein